VAVAEELHFTRAAARLYVSEQTLSRDIRRLEEQLRLTLFIRTTRRVTLTPGGQRLLVRARELLTLHDRTVQELNAVDRPLVVDVCAEGHTPARVLSDARKRAPRAELVARFVGGMGASLPMLLAGQLDITFGRPDGGTYRFPSEQLVRRPIRLEPFAVLLPAAHPLANLEAVPLRALRGTQVDASVGNEDAPGWVDLAVHMLTTFGIEPSPAHLHAAGLDETIHHLHSHGLPILTLSERPTAPGVVVRPLVEPTPLFPWTMAYRRGLDHPGLDALLASADELGVREDWLRRPPNSWPPEPDAALFG
jgi:DNA-binding transcriptional LysR family regulator